MFGENEIYGQKLVNIDTKNRIILPTFTESISGEKIVIQKEEETFNLMSQKYIDLLTERYERIITISDNKNEIFKARQELERLYNSILKMVETDHQKRIVLPLDEMNMKEEKQLKLVGFKKYVKLYKVIER